MNTKKTYAVFGLGRYGTAVAKELVKHNMEVIAIDTDQKLVDDAAAYLPVCKCADVTDAEVISRLGIGNIDTVIVCMAGNLEASVMATTLCKEAGVKTVIAKCANEMHQRILLRVGADQVVFPENESGIRLAKNLLSAGFADMISLSKDVSMIEIGAREEWIGKNLIELSLRRNYGFNVVAIKKGDKVNTEVNPEQVIDENTSLIVIANVSKLGKWNRS
ncbi:MAG: TrkA family potassium uptake protein [Clostridia bacterium]|nr:TrkA family potassium uptake protein [Clostridia bacterium]